MTAVSDDTALILVPGLRPPVPQPRPVRLGKKRPTAARLVVPAAVGAARTVVRGLNVAETTVAGVLVLTGVVVAAALASPAGALVGAWFLGQAYVALSPTSRGVEVSRG